MRSRHIRPGKGAVLVPDGVGHRIGNHDTLPTAAEALEGEIRRKDGDLWACVKTAASTWAWVNLSEIPSLVDPGADRMLFWDDSAGAWAFLTAGTGLSIADTTLSAATAAATGPFVHFLLRPNNTAEAVSAEWTNMPLASTELFGGDFSRKYVDLTDLTEYRFSVEMGANNGAAASTLDLQYSTDIGTPSWTSMGGGTVSLAVASVWVTTGWQDIPVGANAAVLLRVLGAGGNGAVDPRFLNIHAQFR